ncbi:MAG: hypothetical protein WCV93_01485 [Candidatus Shapirobacteria bacterium]
MAKDVFELRMVGGKGVGEAELASMKADFEAEREMVRAMPGEGLEPAKLSEGTMRVLRGMEASAREFLIEKIQRLGIEGYEPDLLPVQYVRHASSDLGFLGMSSEGGYVDVYNRLVVGVDHGPLSTIATLGHELSHAAARTRLVLYMTKGVDGKVELKSGAHVKGLNLPSGQRCSEICILPEELVATMDEVDFMGERVARELPQLYVKERAKIDDEVNGFLVRDAIEEMRRGGWEIPPDLDLVPFVQELGVSESGDECLLLLDGVIIRRYLLGLRISELIGRFQKGEGFTKEDYYRVGRCVLDRDRYVQGNDVHRMLVKIFGGKESKVLFTAGDGLADLEKVHELVSKKELEYKI